MVEKKQPSSTPSYETRKLFTERGEIETRWYIPKKMEAAIVFVGGIGGGFDTPANDLYPKLAKKFVEQNILSLRVKFRNSKVLEQSIFDVSYCIKQLLTIGLTRIALVGHSFGGAAIISAAELYPEIKAIAALASQTFGAGGVAGLEDCSLYFIHGLQDQVLPVSCSIQLYEAAKGKKTLKLLENTGHNLDEKADFVFELLADWLSNSLVGSVMQESKKEE